MPRFRFETTALGQTTVSEEELDGVELASPKAAEKSHAAVKAGADQAGTTTRVYDEAGYLVASVDFSDTEEDRSTSYHGDDELPVEEPGVMRSG